MIDHADKIAWLDHDKDIEPQVVNWINVNLPEFGRRYAQALYRYDEVQGYVRHLPKRETAKSRAMMALQNYSRDQINAMINERIKYVMSRVKVLETHFVAGASSASARTQATNRKDEFNVVAVDIFLRFPEHRFYFANPQ